MTRSTMLRVGAGLATTWLVMGFTASGDPTSVRGMETRTFQDASPAPDDPDTASASRPEYVRVLEWIGAQRDQMAKDLETAFPVLLSRAQEEDPSLVTRLSPPPPPRIQSGYQVIPEITANAPLGTTQPRETRYSIRGLSTLFTESVRDAALLATRVTEDPTTPLVSAVNLYERQRTNKNRLDKHIAYHEFWQKDVAARQDWYDGRNRVVEWVRERERLRKGGSAAEPVAALDAKIREAVAPFHARAGFVVETRADGWRVLPVRVFTDVESPELLRAFESGVATAWNNCEAARERRFRVELTVEFLEPDTLYPEGPPARGASLDTRDHLSRFPDGLVLTTGATSLHAGDGYVQLGPASVSPRVLAHEFGHLLGFADAYLRGYEGDPDGPFGVDLLEWTGLVDDLMGNPGVGVVSPAMIDQLLEAYGPGEDASGPDAG